MKLPDGGSKTPKPKKPPSAGPEPARRAPLPRKTAAPSYKPPPVVGQAYKRGAAGAEPAVPMRHIGNVKVNPPDYRGKTESSFTGRFPSNLFDPKRPGTGIKGVQEWQGFVGPTGLQKGLESHFEMPARKKRKKPVGRMKKA